MSAVRAFQGLFCLSVLLPWLILVHALASQAAESNVTPEAGIQARSDRWRSERDTTRGVRPRHSAPQRSVLEGEYPETGFGTFAGPAGDINGDGFDDVLVAEPGFDHGRGRMLVFHGSAEGLSTNSSWASPGGLAAVADGRVRTARVGDLNGDGYDDLVILDEILDYEQRVPGAGAKGLSLYFGSQAGLPTEPSCHFTAGELGASVFWTCGAAGDVNGDGLADFVVLVVPPGQPGPLRRCLVLLGRPGGAKPVVSGMFDEQSLALVAPAGDVNGDGYGDLLAGLPDWSGQERWRGRVLLYEGSLLGLRETPLWSATYDLPTKKDVDEAYEQFYGWSAASAGDVNGDGFADVLVGAPFADHGDLNEGLAFLYLGSAVGPGRHPAWILESNHPHFLLGYSVTGAGDVNGDGFADVMVGAPYATDGQYNEGAAMVFLGSKHGLSDRPHWCVESDVTQNFMGKEVASAGDINGDTFDDVLVTSPDSLRDGKHFGRVQVFYGSAAGFRNSFGLRLDKPLLTLLQEKIERTHSSAKWGAVGVLFLVTVLAVIGWTRGLAKLREVERETARAQERERITRDVHDHLGAHLSQIALWSELTKEVTHNSSETRQNLEHIAQSARAALNSIGDLVRNLGTSGQSLENFVAHLTKLIQDHTGPTGIRLTLDVPEDLPEASLAADVQRQLSIMVQEALRNMIEHADATEAQLELRLGRYLSLSITDNGRGFAVSKPGVGKPPQTGRGNGLRNLWARAKALGGKCEVTSSPGQGTTVLIALPAAVALAPKKQRLADQGDSPPESR